MEICTSATYYGRVTGGIIDWDNMKRAPVERDVAIFLAHAYSGFWLRRDKINLFLKHYGTVDLELLKDEMIRRMDECIRINRGLTRLYHHVQRYWLQKL